MAVVVNGGHQLCKQQKDATEKQDKRTRQRIRIIVLAVQTNRGIAIAQAVVAALALDGPASTRSDISYDAPVLTTLMADVDCGGTAFLGSDILFVLLLSKLAWQRC